MIFCVEIALTAQLVCMSHQALECTDNGSLAQFLVVPPCTDIATGSNVNISDETDETRAAVLMARERWSDQ
jgi:hypothetical protein